MNKKDLLPILLLLVLFLAYPTIDRKFISRIFPAKEKPVPTAQNAAAAPDLPAETTLTAPAPTPMLEAAVAPEPAELEAQAPDLPEEITILRNEKLELAVSSHGAGIVRAAILGYPATRGAAAPVTFDFEDHPALSISGVLAANAPFKPVAASGRTASFRKVLAGGLELVRSITLGEGYQLDVKDQFTNPTDNVLRLSGYGLNAGFMGNLPDEKMDRVPLLGVDTLTGSQSVEYWGAKFEKWFPNLDRGIQAQTVPGPMEPAQPVDWLAVKNKYLTQIITPETYAEKATLFVKRGAPLKTTAMLFFPRTSYPFDVVSATLTLPEQAIDPGRTLTHSATFYIGPKVYADLKANGPHQEDILQLGFWRPIGILILKIMVWFHDHIWPYNYGLAIILLTFLIRIIFWPLNHKAMASTRHMQAIQPLMAGLKEKYKNDPARQQQEMMALYKEHKIN
ncbi:MAG: membrane protein insertase YidC, partial [Verrucomicrobiota bacterium]|nr:membrane protein insertase YidC [Verrucomicrobiota bacterium]